MIRKYCLFFFCLVLCMEIKIILSEKLSKILFSWSKI